MNPLWFAPTSSPGLLWILGVAVLGVSCITNLAAGMTGAELSHEETKDNAPRGGAKVAKIIATFLEGQDG